MDRRFDKQMQKTYIYNKYSISDKYYCSEIGELPIFKIKLAD